jgi:acetyl-CoA acetyltransferase
MTNPLSVAIVGIGQTEYSRASGRSEWELANEAIANALEDSGIEASEVDGLVHSTYDNVDEAMVLRGLPTTLSFYSQVPYGGLGVPGMVAHAFAAVASGQAKVVVAYRSLNGFSNTRYGRAERSLGSEDDIVAKGDRAPSGAFAAPYGVLSPGHVMALWARRYQALYAVSGEELSQTFSRIAVQQRAYANRNPFAVMRDKTLSPAQYLGGRMITEPLRIFDLALETDGAAAIVVTSRDVAKTLQHRPAYIAGATQGLFRYAETLAIYGELRNGPHYVDVANQLYMRAGLKPKDISTAMLYDATTMTVLLAYEAYGFAPIGKGAEVIREQGIGLESPLPVNTAGGHLSEAYVHFMNSIVEAVRQCRGTSVNQVDDVKAVLCCSGPSAFILRVE